MVAHPLRIRRPRYPRHLPACRRSTATCPPWKRCGTGPKAGRWRRSSRPPRTRAGDAGRCSRSRSAPSPRTPPRTHCAPSSTRPTTAARGSWRSPTSSARRSSHVPCRATVRPPTAGRSPRWCAAGRRSSSAWRKAASSGRGACRRTAMAPMRKPRILPPRSSRAPAAARTPPSVHPSPASTPTSRAPTTSAWWRVPWSWCGRATSSRRTSRSASPRDGPARRAR